MGDVKLLFLRFISFFHYFHDQRLVCYGCCLFLAAPLPQIAKPVGCINRNVMVRVRSIFVDVLAYQGKMTMCQLYPSS